jgi:hypothetical protein
MAGDELIERYLATLRVRLPAGTIEELADGLSEAHRRYHASGLDPDAAARAAITEFGEPDVVLAAFVRQAPGRRAAVGLLCSGPLVGGCWAMSLVLGRAWSWPLPPGVRIIFGSVLTAAVILLVLAATGRRSLRRTRLAAAGGLGLICLDAAALAIVALTTPAFVWPMVLAIPGSLLRMTLTARAMPRMITG